MSIARKNLNFYSLLSTDSIKTIAIIHERLWNSEEIIINARGSIWNISNTAAPLSFYFAEREKLINKLLPRRRVRFLVDVIDLSLHRVIFSSKLNEKLISYIYRKFLLERAMLSSNIKRIVLYKKTLWD